MLDATTKARGGKGAKVNKFGKTGRPSVLDPCTATYAEQRGC